jgi:hypothetical protein
VLASSPYSVDVTDLPNSVKNCVALNALIENLTDTPSRVVCGRPFHPTPTSIDDILDNCDVLFEQLAEFGAPLRKSVLCPGTFAGYRVWYPEFVWTFPSRAVLTGFRSVDWFARARFGNTVADPCENRAG